MSNSVNMSIPKIRFCKSCGIDREDPKQLAASAKSCEPCYQALAYRRRSSSPCVVEGCMRKPNAGKMCAVHCVDKSAPIAKLCQNCERAIPNSRASGKSCSDECSKALDKQRRAALGCEIEGCEKPLYRTRVCRPHYERRKRYGNATAPLGKEIECVTCGSVFRSSRPRAKVCSAGCWSRLRSAANSSDAIQLHGIEFTVEQREANRAKRRAQESRRRQMDPEASREKVRARRARMADNPTFIVTSRDIQRMRHRQRNECFWCHVDLGTVPEQMDHVIPTVHGGSHGIGNLVLSCSACNGSKNEWFSYEWRLSRLLGRPLKSRVGKGSSRSRYTNVESIAPPTDAATSNVVQLVGDK